MLRIHFTEQDLSRVYLAKGPDPLWETVLALFRLSPSAPGRLVFRTWQDRARSELLRCGIEGQRRVLRTLAPANSTYFPDFLTPAEEITDIASGLQALRSTHPSQLRADIEYAATKADLPRWCHELARGDRTRLDVVVESMRALYETVVAPDWSCVEAVVEADRWKRVHALTDGVDGLLDSLRPTFRWQYPILRAAYPVPHDVHLNGQGLRLIPSYFCWRTPVTLVDPKLQPAIVYPIPRGLDHGPGLPYARHAEGLARLLGPTRATVLGALAHGPSTGDLARLLKISASTASEHVRVLREAGLAITSRDGGGATHTLTPLGHALLRNELPPPPSF